MQRRARSFRKAIHRTFAAQINRQAFRVTALLIAAIIGQGGQGTQHIVEGASNHFGWYCIQDAINHLGRVELQ